MNLCSNTQSHRYRLRNKPVYLNSQLKNEEEPQDISSLQTDMSNVKAHKKYVLGSPDSFSERQTSISSYSESHETTSLDHEKIEETQASPRQTIHKNSKKIKKVSKMLESSPENTPDSLEDTTKRQRFTWIPDEDAAVIELVAKHGQKWTVISEKMGRRTAKQIRDRYLHKLRPDIQKGDWTQEEDEALLYYYEQFGPKWSRIVKHMPNRTENQVRNRFNAKLKSRDEEECPELVSNPSFCSSNVVIDLKTEDIDDISDPSTNQYSNINLDSEDYNTLFSGNATNCYNDYMNSNLQSSGFIGFDNL